MVRGVHELALMQSVVDSVVEQVGTEQVVLVRLAIGELAGVATDALRFCFDVCTRNTALANAELDIVSIPGRARCRTCTRVETMRSLASPCSCGSFDRELVAGNELRLVEVEVL